MERGIHIRPATPVDAPSLTRCIDAAYARYFAEGLDLPPVSSGVAQDIQDHVVLVAQADGAVVGGAILSVTGGTAHLMNLFVDPEHTGRKIGSLLLQSVTDVARAAGHTRMRLATHRDMPRNVSYYQRRGWQVSGSEDVRIFMEIDLT
ncbi:GNAT family N-acetyltransferase [Rhodobacteraceae bacterium M382]|nr:GNAT family N-acetyltransferase [Rhodobacteraceae bacterium M382]